MHLTVGRDFRVLSLLLVLIGLGACGSPLEPVVAGAFALPGGTEALSSTWTTPSGQVEKWIVADTFVFLPDGTGEARTTAEERRTVGAVVGFRQIVPFTFELDGDWMRVTWRPTCLSLCAASVMTTEMKLRDGVLHGAIGASAVRYEAVGSFLAP